MIKKRRVAVFDIDGTIFRSSLLVELVDELIAQGVFPKKSEREYLAAKESWLDRKDHYDKYIWGVILAFEKHIKGVAFKDFKRVVRRVVDGHQFRVYRYTRDLIRELKRKKYFLLAISHSPKYIVHDFAVRLGFDKVYGRILEWDDKKRFTGRAYYEDIIQDKSKILNRALLKEDLVLSGSVGVGDTDSDIAFLKMVENPICFNPNSKLYSYARKRGWRVVVERKDVVYQLNPEQSAGRRTKSRI